jgi:hypothetical protein
MRVEYLSLAEAFPQDWQAVTALDTARATHGHKVARENLARAFAATSIKGAVYPTADSLYVHAAKLDRRVLDSNEQNTYFRFAGELLTRTQLLFAHNGSEDIGQDGLDSDGHWQTYTTRPLDIGPADTDPNNMLYAQGTVKVYSYTTRGHYKRHTEDTHDVGELGIAVFGGVSGEVQMHAHLAYPNLHTLSQFHDHMNEQPGQDGAVPELPYVTGSAVTDAIEYARVLDFVEGRLGVVQEILA